MGAKGHSINTTDISASYVVLSSLCDKITDLVSDMNAHKTSLSNMVQSGDMDSQSSEDLDNILQDLTKINRNITDKVNVVKKILNESLEASKGISDRAKSRSNVTRENIGKAGSKLGGKI